MGKRGCFRNKRKADTRALLAEMGLRELHPGDVCCLLCERIFPSWDVRENRRCARCDELLYLAPTPEVLYE